MRRSSFSSWPEKPCDEAKATEHEMVLRSRGYENRYVTVHNTRSSASRNSTATRSARVPHREGGLTIRHSILYGRRRMKAAPNLCTRCGSAIPTKHYSIRTQEASVGWLRRLILFRPKRPRAGRQAREIVLTRLTCTTKCCRMLPDSAGRCHGPKDRASKYSR
jgi:hypothetical protein